MRKSASFYKVSLCEKYNASYGVAYFPHTSPVPLLSEFHQIPDWQKLKLTLKDGDYFDYLANDRGVRLMSEKLQSFIESHRSPDDALQWLPVSVAQKSKVQPYYILHFSRDLKPLNRTATKWIDGWYPRVPVIRKKLIGHHKIFGLHTGGYNFIVSQDMRELLRREFNKCFDFQPLDTA